MWTVQISDEIYQELLSRRVGRESISTTIKKNLIPAEEGWDVEKLSKDLEKIKRTSKPLSLEEAFR